MTTLALRLLADGPPADTAGAIGWINRHAVVASSMTPQFVALFAGYVIALAVARYRAAPPAATAAASVPARAPTPERPPLISATSTAFDQPFYVLRLRGGSGIVGLLLGRSFVEYTLQTIPPSSRSEFFFSWATGVLRRAPSGPQVLRLQAAERHDLLKRAYIVSDPVSGALIGKLLPRADDWQIADAAGRTIADAVQAGASFHQTKYSITTGGRELCRLTAVMGATAASAEVQIEFLPAAVDGTVDRSLVVALAPLVEDRARRRRM